MRLKLTILAILTLTAFAGSASAEGECPRAGTLGVGRTVEIDTTGGPGFGMQHYKAYDFLEPKEVVLTFDDGPQKFSTEMVLAALAAECTKATFFSIGKMALGYPEIIREVAKAGHTIGTHTWSHAAIAKLKTFDLGKDEIERGFSAVKRAVGGPIAPFFRFPTLVDTPEAIAYLGKRNIAMFSTDIDSFDFKPQSPDHIVKTLMAKLEKAGKGIILMHDIHKTTAKALPGLLSELKAKGYKIVHLTAKAPVETLAEYDSAIEKDAKGLPQIGAERPLSSIVRTVGSPPAGEKSGPAATKGESSSGAAAGEGGSEEEPAGESASDGDKPGIERQKSSLPRPTGTATTASIAPAGVEPSAAPAPTPAPVAAAAAVAAPAPGASVVSTKPSVPGAPTSGTPVVTSSVVRNVSASDAGTAIAPAKAPAAEPSPSAADAGPKKSVSERAKEIWQLWFGE